MAQYSEKVPLQTGEIMQLRISNEIKIFRYKKNSDIGTEEEEHKVDRFSHITGLKKNK